VNRDGPAVLGGVPAPAALSGDEIARIAPDGDAVVLDTRPWSAFRAGHLKGSLFAPLDAGFPGVAGSYIPESAQVYIVGDQADAVVRALIRVGIDRVAGIIRPADLANARGLETTEEIGVPEALARREKGAQVLDVRKPDEWAEGHIPGATRAVHTRLPAAIKGLSKDRPVVVHCQGGVRSARAAALLQREGFKVANLAGGFRAWEGAGAPVER
jgi:hydroxyacylglutathione hydrolase